MKEPVCQNQTFSLRIWILLFQPIRTLLFDARGSKYLASNKSILQKQSKVHIGKILSSATLNDHKSGEYVIISRVPNESNSYPEFWKISGKNSCFSGKILGCVVLKQRKLSYNLYANFFQIHLQKILKELFNF